MMLVKCIIFVAVSQIVEATQGTSEYIIINFIRNFTELEYALYKSWYFKKHRVRGTIAMGESITDVSPPPKKKDLQESTSDLTVSRYIS